ncbi:putative fructokinase-6, chloroplastic [Gracilariopsis chorda]|uniref:Putative fructokinase-6, chloroplastic n=1 Tax=Gracilariopsis chorda TaxID=448386 RepID=A0A2V3IGM1_9FLOR|nr:putative fructokinase-6, chloroplastic [Gracilariopsis chorda]|eukprot:PXF41246.1 putative fructokinase-6, chloroplastic [Gracilariopsis chorda]
MSIIQSEKSMMRHETHSNPGFIAPQFPSKLPSLRTFSKSARPPRSRPFLRACARAPLRETEPINQSPLGAPQVLCAGEVLYDLYAPPNTPRTQPELWNRVPGGGPANVAAALAQLETGSAFIGMVGDDDAGNALRKALLDMNVNVDGLQQATGRQSRTVFVKVDQDGERDFVGFGGENQSFADTQQIDAERLPGVLFYAAKFVMLPTLGLAFEGCASSFSMLLDMAKMCLLESVVDVNWRPVFWQHYSDEDARKRIRSMVQKVDILKLSVDELSFLYGKQLADIGLTEPQTVLNRVGTKGVLVTDGRNGSAYAFNYGSLVHGRCEAIVPEGGVVDTTGAGDAFLAGFLSRMLRLGGTAALVDEDKVKDIVRFATATASFVIAGEGVFGSLPTLKQVEELVAKL